MAAAPTLPLPRRNTGYAPVFRPGTPEFRAASAQAATPGWQKAIGDAFLNVATLGEHSNPGSVRQYGHDLRDTYDPTHPEGIANIAALFPGRLTPVGAAYMEQLRTHDVQRLHPLGRPDEPRFVYTPKTKEAQPGSHFAKLREPYKNAPVLSREEVEASPELKAIAEVFGHTIGTPHAESYVNAKEFADSGFRTGISSHPGDILGLNPSKPSRNEPLMGQQTHKELYEQALARLTPDQRRELASRLESTDTYRRHSGLEWMGEMIQSTRRQNQREALKTIFKQIQSGLYDPQNWGGYGGN